MPGWTVTSSVLVDYDGGRHQVEVRPRSADWPRFIRDEPATTVIRTVKISSDSSDPESAARYGEEIMREIMRCEGTLGLQCVGWFGTFKSTSIR
jgi:hypothetical protein